MGGLPAGSISTAAGPYRMVRRLGSGGMGVVYLAVAEGSGDRAAERTGPEPSRWTAAVGVIAPIVTVLVVAVIAWNSAATPSAAAVIADLLHGHTGWLLAASGLLLVVVPGMALCHGGAGASWRGPGLPMLAVAAIGGYSFGAAWLIGLVGDRLRVAGAPASTAGPHY